MLEFNNFSEFSEEMLTYCRRDVELTHKVYNHLKLEGKRFSNYSLRLEHDIRSIDPSMGRPIDGSIQRWEDP